MPGSTPSMISTERLHELLAYDPVTGVFTWRRQQRAQSPVGSRAGTVGNHGYVQIRVAGKIYLAHRLAWLYVHGQWPLSLIDHANHNRLDNRISNLREASRSANAANASAHRDSATGLKGVCACRKRFQAEICLDGKKRFLGVFDTPQEAHDAYCRAAAQTFGEFARAE